MRRSAMCKSAVTRKKNQKSKYSPGYALTGFLLCGKCRQEYRRVTWVRNGRKKIVWRCSDRLTNGVKKCGDSETLEEGALIRAVIEAIYRKDGTYTQEFDERYRRIAEEINALKEEQAETGKKKKLTENYEQRVKDMDASLNGNAARYQNLTTTLSDGWLPASR